MAIKTTEWLDNPLEFWIKFYWQDAYKQMNLSKVEENIKIQMSVKPPMASIYGTDSNMSVLKMSKCVQLFLKVCMGQDIASISCKW